MRIIGIDPGLACTGYALLEEKNCSLAIVEIGVVKTKAQLLLSERLKIIYQNLKELIVEYKPDSLAVEQVFAAKNIQSTIKLSHARAMAVLLAGEFNLLFHEFTPREVKQNITGTGNADKAQVQFMVKNILKLEKIITPDDAADAVAIAISGIRAVGYQNRLNQIKK